MLYGGIILPANVRKISHDGEYVAVLLNDAYVLNHGTIMDYRITRIAPGPWDLETALSFCKLTEDGKGYYLDDKYIKTGNPPGLMHPYPSSDSNGATYTRKALWPKVCNMYNRGIDFDYATLKVPLELLDNVPYIAEIWMTDYGKMPTNKKIIA